MIYKGIPSSIVMMRNESPRNANTMIVWDETLGNTIIYSNDEE
jgi:hypothetical protein